MSTAPYQDQHGALSSQLNPDLTRPRCGGRRVSQAGSINYTAGEVFLQRCCAKMPGALKAREKTYELVPGSGDGSGGRPGPAFKGSQLPAEHLRGSAFQSILHTLHKVRGPWGPGQHLTPAQEKEEDVLFVYLVLGSVCPRPRGPVGVARPAWPRACPP
ncbi:unnamed protein product [Arctogadus glacialis]